MLASTHVVLDGDRLRLVLEDDAALRTAEGAAVRLYESLGGRTNVYPIARPTSPQSGVWVQDVRAGVGGRTVGELVAQVEAVGLAEVRDVSSLAARDLSPERAAQQREAVTEREGEAAREESPLTRLLNVYKGARVIMVAGAIIAIAVYAWPLLRTFLAARAARGSA